MTTIIVPDQVRSGDYAVIVSMSGGKDSTATALALREAGVDVARYVFADTGWEAPETYEHLDELRRLIGPIDVVRGKMQMADRIRHGAGAPTRLGKWCTPELKVAPLQEYFAAFELETGVEPVSAVGIRAAESERRAAMVSFEDDARWGGFVWRPIISWSVADVIAIHHRHGVGVNPLYLAGHDRVGCYPCIHSSKGEIKLIAENHPERIDEIRALEDETTRLRAERNVEKPGRYKYPVSTFFQSRAGAPVATIDRVVAWSKTDRGGHQLPMLVEPPSGGCFRWGLCEPPAENDGSKGAA